MGLLAAVEAADAMLKAADVRLLEKNLASGGLVTISVTGEVAAVQAAVEAAAASVRRIDAAGLVSQHVIPRPDREVAHIIATTPPECPPDPEAPEVCEDPEETEILVESVGPATPEEGEAPAEESPEPEAAVPADEPMAKLLKDSQVHDEPQRHTISQLKKMSVTRLRQIARSLGGAALPQDKISTAKKKDLIESIVNVYRQREE